MHNLTSPLFDEQVLTKLSDTIIDEAKKAGAKEVEVRISANKGFSVSAHQGDVETIEYNQDKIIEVVVHIGKRRGMASITDIRPQAIRDAALAACHIAQFTDEDPDMVLASKDELAFGYEKPQLAFPWDISVDDAIQMAITCERQAVAQDKRIMRAEDVRVSTVIAWEVYANTAGFIGMYPHTRHELSCILVAKSADEMQRDYSYTIADDPSLLKSTDYIAKEAVKKTLMRLGGRSLPTMKVPVIYLNEEARNLIGYFVEGIRGSNLFRKNSFLLNQLNKPVFPKHLQIFENPFLLHGLGSAPFDDDGVSTRENHFVVDGYLKQYALGVYSAHKLKMKTTGNAGGVHNLTLSTGDKNLNELLKAMGKGVLITEMMGQGVNLLTGNYSRGASGFWVENGEIQYPVHEITVAGKLQDIFKNIVEIGNDVDKRGNIRTGSILVEEMTIAGT